MGKGDKQRRSRKQQIERDSARLWIWIALAVVVVFYAAIRIRLLAIPLERDEGEYAYAGQLILEGIPPYQLAYNMKLPGVYYAYALIMAVFGQSAAGIHAGLLLINAASIILVFLIGRKLFDAMAGVVASAAFGYLTVNQWILGTQAHATHFVVLPVLGGLLLLLKAGQGRALRHVFWSGLLLGTAFVMKQHGIFFLTFGLLYLLLIELKSRPFHLGKSLMKAGVYAGGSILPVLAVFMVLYFAGVFPRFWFWAVQYAGKYVSEIGIRDGIDAFLSSAGAMMAPSYLLWMLAGAGLSLLWIDRESRASATFLTWFFVFAFLSICPGFHFRKHYYVTWVPAVSLLIAAAVHTGRNVLCRVAALKELKFAPAAVFVIFMVVTVSGASDFLFSVSAKTASVMMYGNNPWTETEEIGKFIKANTQPDDTIAVLGSEPQLYFYAARRSATGYIYTYALMELQDYAHRMQLEMIGEIERARPQYIVFASNARSWGVRSRSDRTILEWQTRYCAANYRLVGFAQSYQQGGNPADYRTEYAWEDQVNVRKPDPRLEPLYVFKRK